MNGENIRFNNMNTDQHHILLDKIVQGDEHAMQEFYKELQGAVYAFAVSRLRNEFDANECTNEVMMEVWKTAERFEGRSTVKTWLLGITNFKVLDCLRKRKRHFAEELDEEMTESLPNDDLPMQDVLMAVDDAKLVRFCLDKLSDRHSQIVHLVFYEDLSYPEVSELIDCPEGTVKTRIFHAKQKLMDCLSRRMH